MDSKTGNLSGTPGYDAADAPLPTLTIKATDKAGLSASMALTINAINKPTVLGTVGSDSLKAGDGDDSLSSGAGNDRWWVERATMCLRAEMAPTGLCLIPP